MRKILASALCILATVVAAKTSVMASEDSWDLLNSATWGKIDFGYAWDFGYAGSSGYSVDATTNLVS